MATWGTVRHPDETCETCGSIYEVEERLCNEVLREVRSGTADFVYSIKKRGTKA